MQIYEWPRHWALAFIGVRGPSAVLQISGAAFYEGSEFARGEVTFPEVMHEFDAVDRNRRAPCSSRTSQAARHEA